MEDAHPEGAHQELRRPIRAASAPLHAGGSGGGGAGIVADEAAAWCGGSLRVGQSRLVKGRRCCLGRGSGRRRAMWRRD